MSMPTKATVGLLLPPVLVSFSAFVLAMIALLAGTGPQQKSLEPYHIIAVNLSGFGQDIISPPKPTPTPVPGNSDGSSLGNPFDQIVDGGDGMIGLEVTRSIVNDITDDITDGLNNLTNQAADKIIQELGISEWYSVHIMSTCEGMFSPNASSSGAWFNMTHCKVQQSGLRLNLSDILDHEVEAGPFHLNTNQVQVPDTVQDAIDIVNNALLALLVVYALASGFAGLTFIVSLMVLILLRKRLTQRVIWANIGLAGLGAFVLLIGSSVVTYVNNKGVPAIDEAGLDVGISGIRGDKFILLSWLTFALMLFTSSYWALATLKFTQKWIIVDEAQVEKGKSYA